jgi:hypothetical protein
MLGKKKTQSEEELTIEAVAEFALKTEIVKSLIDTTQFLDPRLNEEADVLKKVLFYVVSATDVSSLKSVADFLNDEATKKAKECNELRKLVGSINLEGEE